MTSQLEARPSREAQFANRLDEIVREKNLAALAALRRAVGKEPGEEIEPYRYIGGWLAGCRTGEEAAWYFRVAALFATHQVSWPGATGRGVATNFGASLRRLRLVVEASGGNAEGIERRLVALLNCHVDDLPKHLRQAVSLLKSREVPADWAQLLRDVRRWDWDSRSVQRDWARAFWADPAGPEAEASVEETPTSNVAENGEE